MSSVNISLKESVYDMLKNLKKDDESFSDVIEHLVKEKDIRRCFGLLKDYKEDMEIIEKEAIKARKEKWREVKL